MTAPIDFQNEENRWAAEIACAETNAIIGSTYDYSWVVPGAPSLYALALRILRTEARPDPLVKALQDAGVVPGGMSIVTACSRITVALHQQGFEIAALKERGVWQIAVIDDLCGEYPDEAAANARLIAAAPDLAKEVERLREAIRMARLEAGSHGACGGCSAIHKQLGDALSLGKGEGL